MPTAVDPSHPAIESEPKTSVVARGAETRTAENPPSATVSVPPGGLAVRSANAADASTSPPPDEAETEELTPVLDKRQLTVGGYGISLLLHLSIFALLTTIIFKAEEPDRNLDSITLWEGEPEPLDAVVVEEPVKLDLNLNPVERQNSGDEPSPEMKEELAKTDILDQDNVVQDVLKPKLAEPELANIPFSTGIVSGEGTMFSGRGTSVREAMVAASGGNSESELAVAMGLRWLADHQQPDGSWSFDHRGEKCGNSCTDPGGLSECTMGATSMALLTFLGAGHTHQTGEYSSQVRSGLDHLLKNMLDTNDGIDLRQGNRQGNMYVQGLATIAICEAYAMTKDPALFRPSQRAINFIVHAQHKGGGLAIRDQPAGRHLGRRLASARPRKRENIQTQGSPRHLWQSDQIPQQRSKSWRGAVWVYVSFRFTDHHGGRPGLPHVLRLGPRPQGNPRRGRLSLGDRSAPRQHVLQLLRHPGAASLRWRRMDPLEREDARPSGRYANSPGARQRKLGSARPSRQFGRAALHDDARHDDAGSLLPASSAVSVARFQQVRHPPPRVDDAIWFRHQVWAATFL